jgi:hypothetical protein
MYPSFAPEPNHTGAGSVSSTGIHITAPVAKNERCSTAWTSSFSIAAS